MEAQQGLLQVSRAAGLNKVLEGAIDALPAALHGEDAQAQLPAMEAVGDMDRDGAMLGRTLISPWRGGDIQPGPESGPRWGGWSGGCRAA